MYNNLNIRPEAIANRIIDICAKGGVKDITNMKIQKILYYVYAEYFKEHSEFLFDTKQIKFWQHGPVIVDAYHSLKHFKNGFINEFIRDLSCNNEEIYEIVDFNENDKIESIIKVIKIIFNKIGNKTASELRELSHNENSIWKKITNNGKDFNNKFLHEDNLRDLVSEVKSI